MVRRKRWGALLECQRPNFGSLPGCNIVRLSAGPRGELRKPGAALRSGVARTRGGQARIGGTAVRIVDPYVWKWPLNVEETENVVLTNGVGILNVV